MSGGRYGFRDRTERSDRDPMAFDKIFVMGCKSFNQDDFRKMFSEFGEIKNVYLKKSPNGESKGLTHVKFAKCSQACLAAEAMNGKHVDGDIRPIKVIMALEKNLLEMDSDEDRILERLFLRVPKSMTKDELKETFSQYGEVTWCHILMNKQTGESRGLGYVKFAKSSQAARAMEECDSSYGPKWADVRLIENSRNRDHHGPGGGMGGEMGGGMGGGGGMWGGPGPSGGGMGGLAGGMMDIIQSKSRGMGRGFGMGGMGMDDGGFDRGGFDRGMGMDRGGFDRGMGMGGGMGMGRGMGMGGAFGGRGGAMGGAFGGGYGFPDDRFPDEGFSDGFPKKRKPAEPGEPMYYIENRTDMGTNQLQAKVPEGMTLEQVNALFNICPGLESCNLNPKTCIAKIQYESAKCASFAQEKTNGLNYAGHMIETKLGKISGSKALEETATQLQETLMKLTMSGNPDPEELTKLVESIQRTTAAIEAQGEEDQEEEDYDENTLEMATWCSVPLPSKKPMASAHADIKERLFVVAVPDSFSNELLENAFCRFGNLIKCRFQQDKRFGFAHYADKDSADAAKRTLHGENILNNLLRVEFASSPENTKSGDRKRTADW